MVNSSNTGTLGVAGQTRFSSNVGINCTPNSSYRLDVVGTINCTEYRLNGAAFTTGIAGINSTGSIGINKASPGYTLDVNGNIAANGFYIGRFTIFPQTTNGYTIMSLVGGNATGYIYGDFQLLNDGIHMGYNYYGSNGVAYAPAGFSSGCSRISMGYGTITFNVGYTSVLTQMVVVDSTGIRVRGDVTAGSDRRYKENIVTIDSALDKVTSMRGVYFTRKDSPERHVGVIAQEMEEILPEVVHTDSSEEKMKSVSYGNITAVLIEAIKEQQSIINAQQSTINGILYKFSTLEQI